MIREEGTLEKLIGRTGIGRFSPSNFYLKGRISTSYKILKEQS